MLRLFSWLLLVCIAIGLVATIAGIAISLWTANYSSEPALFLTAGAVAYLFIYRSTKGIFE